MTQHNMDYYMKNKIESELNNIIVNTKEQNNELDDIVEVKYGNEIYKTWKVKFIRPLIIKFLKEKYPYSLIIREVNDIDIVIFDNKSVDRIPVEIQKTPITRGTNNKTFSHTEFEQSIRKQLEDNIENYKLCWFFFDSEYLRYLQSDNVSKQINIDMTWLVKLMKEETLKVFTIKYDGLVKELTTKDFDFLKDISQICSIGYDNDERILNRNKLEIYYNIVKGYSFTQEEITQFENDFDNRNDNKYKHSSEYFKNSNNEKCKLYGNIITAIGCLSIINSVLSCTLNSNKNKYITEGITLGIFYQNEFYGGNINARIQFTDKFEIAQYFPGYIKNKQLWNYCKNKQRIFTISEFNGIIEGTFNYEFIKKQSTVLDY